MSSFIIELKFIVTIHIKFGGNGYGHFYANCHRGSKKGAC